MSSRVHAIIVASAGDSSRSVPHLERTLSALGAASVTPDAVTVVVPEGNAELLAVVANSALSQLNARTLRGNFSFVDAVQSVQLHPEAELVWLLSQDSAPKRLALGHLLRVLETTPTVAIAAPKLLRWRNEHQIVSQGVTMTRRTYRAVDLIRGDFDQGQHNDREEILGADIRGMLVRRKAWESIGGLDRAFARADLGLDLGYRAWLGNWRVRAVPTAEVLTAGDMVAGSADPWNPVHARREYLQQRRARYHRMLSYSPAGLVPFVWLAILPMAFWYTLTGLLAKRPWTISANWGAALVSMFAFGAVAASRRKIAKAQQISRTQFTSLFADHQQLSDALGSNYAAISGPVTRRSIAFFSGGGAWIVLALLVLSAVLFYPLLRWQSLAGGGALPLGDSALELWRSAFFALPGAGVAPAVLQDPFVLVMSVLGTLTFWAPSTSIILLWLLAMPLAGFGAWIAATRLSDKAAVRALVAVLWALMPSLLTALNEGRVAAVIVHLLLPWLFYTASVALRSWGSAAAASIIATFIVAAAPSLLPALILVTLAALLFLAITRQARGALRVLWVPLPAILFFLPLAISQFMTANPWAILADSGPVVPWLVADSPLAQLWQIFGLSSLGSEQLFGLPDALAWLPLLAFAPLFAFAGYALFARRYVLAISFWLVMLVGALGTMLFPALRLAHTGAQTVAIWFGPHSSVALLGLLLAAALAYDAWWQRRPLQRRTKRLFWRNLSAHILAGTAVVLLAVVSFPAMNQVLRGEAVVHAGTGSTLPAYVTASGASNPSLGTLLIDPIDQNTLSSTVVWGGTDTMISHPTKITTELILNEAELQQAELVADLTRSSQPGAIARLSQEGIAFVLLRNDQGSDAASNELLLSSASALNANPALDAVGSTERGQLWRVSIPVSEREPLSGSDVTISRLMWLLYGIFGLSVLLLAMPTVDSVRRAQRMPRQIALAERRS